ncbi:MAG: hypothetical protein RBS39_06215 [Phycisphaerales bacterium]|nr:hypothetical protein [Phycisphaerales bacterium]
MSEGSQITVWHSLAEIARWAPSPHNTQPWQLRPIDGERAELLMVSKRRLPDEDTTGCFLVCAMGIFIEAMRIAAANHGRRLEANVRASLDLTPELIPFADLTLTGSAEPDEFPDDSILSRRTSRLACLPGPMPALDARIEQIAHRYGHEVHLVTAPDTISAVMSANANAVMHDLADSRYGTEIRRWYRYTRAQAERTRDGLESRCMNVPAHEMWLSARCPWLMRAPVLRQAMKRLYQRRVGVVPALLALRGPFFEHAAAVRAGSMLLRLWLALHETGLTIHPFGNLVTNPSAHRRLIDALGIEGVWLVARVGRTATPPRSLRLDTGDLIRA